MPILFNACMLKMNNRIHMLVHIYKFRKNEKKKGNKFSQIFHAKINNFLLALNALSFTSIGKVVKMH